MEELLELQSGLSDSQPPPSPIILAQQTQTLSQIMEEALITPVTIEVVEKCSKNKSGSIEKTDSKEDLLIIKNLLKIPQKQSLSQKIQSKQPLKLNPSSKHIISNLAPPKLLFPSPQKAKATNPFSQEQHIDIIFFNKQKNNTLYTLPNTNQNNIFSQKHNKENLQNVYVNRLQAESTNTLTPLPHLWKAQTYQPQYQRLKSKSQFPTLYQTLKPLIKTKQSSKILNSSPSKIDIIINRSYSSYQFNPYHHNSSPHEIKKLPIHSNYFTLPKQEETKKSGVSFVSKIRLKLKSINSRDSRQKGNKIKEFLEKNSSIYTKSPFQIKKSERTPTKQPQHLEPSKNRLYLLPLQSDFQKTLKIPQQ